MPQSFSTLWPDYIEPDNDDIVACSAVVADWQEAVAPISQLHTHPTGQLTVPVSGFVGVQYAEGLRAIPFYCAHWTPQGVPHNGAISKGSKSFFINFGHELAGLIPNRVTTFMLNPMTFEMIAHYANCRMTGKDSLHEKHIAQVIAEEIAGSKELPGHYVPLPENEKVQQLAIKILQHDGAMISCEAVASELGLSERTLRRLILQETGMSFRDWKFRLTMMRALSDLAVGKTIQETAFNCGFSSASSFTTSYKRHFGETPGKFRSNAFGTAGINLDER